MDKKRKNKEKNTKSEYGWIYSTVLYGMAMLLVFTPLFRGTFFASTQYKALMVVSLLFGLVGFLRYRGKDINLKFGPLDIFILALPVIYFLAVFNAVNYGLAVNEVLKYALYCLTYFVVKYIAGRNGTEFLIRVIFGASVLVAVVGFLSAAGIIYIQDSFYGERICSSLQYPNSLACYLGAAGFLGIFLWAKSLAGERKILYKIPGTYLYNAGIYVVLTALVGTKSLGGLAVLAVVYVIFLMLVEFRSRLYIIADTLLVGIVSFYTAKKVLDNLVSGGSGKIWLWLMLGLLLTLGVQFFMDLLHNRFSGRMEGSKKQINTLLASALVLAAAAAGWYMSVHDFGGRLATGVFRMDYLKDAVRMYMDRPLLGWGGGAWEDLVRIYQEYLYNSTLVHSYIGQVAVESGTLGLLAVAGMWLSFLYMVFRLYTGGEEKNHIAAITAAALMIGGHSLLDFDLSLSAIALVLWTMFGIISGMNRWQIPMDLQILIGNSKSFVAASVVSVTIFTGAFLLASSDSMFVSAYPKDVQAMESAVKTNPLNAQHNYLLARSYSNKNEQEKASERAMRAVELARYNVNYLMTLSNLALLTGKYELAHESAEKALAYAPMVWTVYENYSRVCYSIGFEKLKSGDKNGAGEFFNRTLAVNGALYKRINDLTQDQKEKWEGGVLPTPTEVMLLGSGAASVFLDDWAIAEENLQKVVNSNDKKLKSQALFWLSVMNHELGNEKKAEELLKQAAELEPTAAKRYDGIVSLAKEKI